MSPTSASVSVCARSSCCVPERRSTEDEVKEYVRENLARYKIPREVVFLDELPRNPTGKVLKRELAETLVAGDRSRLHYTHGMLIMPPGHAQQIRAPIRARWMQVAFGAAVTLAVVVVAVIAITTKGHQLRQRLRRRHDPVRGRRSGDVRLRWRRRGRCARGRHARPGSAARPARRSRSSAARPGYASANRYRPVIWPILPHSALSTPYSSGSPT